MLPILLAACLGPAPTQRSAPPECSDADALHREVEQHMGRSVAADEVQVALKVDGGEGQYRATLLLTIDGQSYARALTAESCDALRAAASLVVAASLAPMIPDPADPEAELPAAARETDPAPPVEPYPSRREVDTPATRAPHPGPEPPRGRAPPRLSLGAAAGLGVGALPRATGVFRVHLELARRWLRSGIAGSYWLRRGTPADRDERRTTVQLGAAEIYGCAAWGRAQLQAGPCVSVEVGGMHGNAGQATDATPRSALWVAARAGVFAALQVSRRIRVVGSVDLGLAAVRPTYVLGTAGGDQALYEPSLVSGRVLGGIEVALTQPRAGKTPRRSSDGRRPDPDVGGARL